jgi:hypothetical protein
MAEQQRLKDGTLLFDIFLDDRWVGMANGNTPAEAREMLIRSWSMIGDPSVARTAMLVPYYGVKTSDETYEALTGRKSLTIGREKRA